MEPIISLRNMTSIYIRRGEEMLLLYRVGSRVVAPSWCGIGGHFEQEELNDPYACVLREMEEEIGLTEADLENVKLRYVTLRLKNGEIRQNYYYFAELKEGVLVTLASDEGQVRWVPMKELLSREMPLTAKQMLTHYVEAGQFTDTLYSGTTQSDHMIFAPLLDF